MSNLHLNGPSREVRLSPGEAPRRRGDRETTPGRCANLDYCSIGMQRILVQVPVNQPFTCPECGGRLRAPGMLARAQQKSALPYVRMGVLIVAMAVSLTAGYVLGRSQTSMTRLATEAAHDARQQVAVAGSRLGLIAPPPAADMPAAAPAPGPAQLPAPLQAGAPSLSPPPKPVIPALITAQPYPVKLAPVDTTIIPRHLLEEARFGQVTIDCALDALLTKPNCHISDVRGSSAFAQATLDWLSAFSVQYAPETRKGSPALLDHRWRVVFQDFSGRQAEDSK